MAHASDHAGGVGSGRMAMFLYASVQFSQDETGRFPPDPLGKEPGEHWRTAVLDKGDEELSATQIIGRGDRETLAGVQKEAQE